MGNTMAQFEDQLKTLQTFFVSDESRQEVLGELRELNDQAIELAPQFLYNANVIAVTNTIALSKLTAYSVNVECLCFVNEPEEHHGGTVPSSLAEKQLFWTRAHPDGGLSVRTKLLELFELPEWEQTKQPNVLQVALILEELRKAITEMKAGEFRPRRLNL